MREKILWSRRPCLESSSMCIKKWLFTDHMMCSIIEFWLFFFHPTCCDRNAYKSCHLWQSISILFYMLQMSTWCELCNSSAHDDMLLVLLDCRYTRRWFLWQVSHWKPSKYSRKNIQILKIWKEHHYNVNL